LSPIRHSRIIPVISVLVIVATLVIGAGVLVQRQRLKVLSEEILPPIEPGDEARLELLPNMDGSVVVVPDRPHNPDEMEPGALERISRQRTFTISTNSRGFRGPEVELPAPRYRVLCVGDSVTLGWGVEYEESWPAQLTEILGVDTVIAAVPGAQPKVMLPWIRLQAAELDADLVLFSWGPLFDGEPLDALVTELQAIAAEIEPIRLGWVLPPTSTFDLHGYGVAQHLYPSLPERVPAIPVLDLTPPFREFVPVGGVIGEMRHERQLMLHLPDMEVIAEAASPVTGAPIAPEFIALFEANPALREPLFFDQGHPDGQGLRLMAELIAEWIQDQGWLPPAR
jgi:hypothetical protein